jgi:hypothetical protein
MFLLPTTDENQRNQDSLILNMVSQKGVPLSVMITVFEPSKTPIKSLMFLPQFKGPWFFKLQNNWFQHLG